MNKEREIDGIKIVVNGEQYEAYKGTLQDKIKKQSKYIEMLQNNIKKLVEENKELEKQLNCKKEFTKYLPKDTEFIILTKPDYDRQQEELQDKVFELQDRIEKAVEDLEKTKELNGKHILARDNIIIHLDIDHIEYLLNILKGDNK